MVFDCNFCPFVSEALGELKIHIYNSHDGTSPSYLDMAEAAVIRLEDGTGFGLNQEDIVKVLLSCNRMCIAHKILKSMNTSPRV